MAEVVEHKHIIIRAELKDFFAPEAVSWKNWLLSFLPACWRPVSAPIAWCTDLVEKMGMNLLIPPQAVYLDRPGLRGWTIICVIETSHIVIHVWDEPTPVLAQFDVYTCGSLDTHVVLEHLAQFKPSKIDYLLIDRENTIMHLEEDTVIMGAV
jgi:S-adenosylmethionine/arginine decarboxylase-like enzyme